VKHYIEDTKIILIIDFENEQTQNLKKGDSKMKKILKLSLIVIILIAVITLLMHHKRGGCCFFGKKNKKEGKKKKYLW